MPHKNEEDRKRYNRREDVKFRNNKNRRERYANDPEYKRRIMALSKKYGTNKKEKRNKREREKRKTDLKYNLNCRMSCSILDCLKRNKGGRHWGNLVDYTLDDLMKRLKKTMPKGYTWKDFFEGKLHIDHIIPKSAFNYSKAKHIDFKRCYALSNLQLLPAEENRIKSNRLTKPFQPALKLTGGS